MGIRCAGIVVAMAAFGGGCAGIGEPRRHPPAELASLPRARSLPPATARARSEPAVAMPVALSKDKTPLPLAPVNVPAESPAVPATAPVDSLVVPASAADEREPCRRLYEDAAQRFSGVQAFISRLRRRSHDSVGKPKPDEVILFKWRRSPWSIHLKWIGDNYRGREVLYVLGRPEDKLHVLTAAGDIPFAAAGKRMAIAPDSMLARAASPHRITEAGLDNNIAELARLYGRSQTGDGVVFTYLGRQPRPEFPGPPMEVIEIKLPPGVEPELPQGGIRRVFFDPATKLPLVYLSFDHTGKEYEYNCFDRLQLDLKLDDHDFDPDVLWAKPADKK